MSPVDSIEGVRVEELTVHADERGSFTELFRGGAHDADFLQANHSRSLEGVLRGLHYHRKQADLWYLAEGRIVVGLADLRHRSDTPATAVLELDSAHPRTVFIPPGIAHGFYALTDMSLFYWVTEEYDASDEFGIAWNDPTLALGWGTNDPILSERDRQNEPLVWDCIPRF